MTTWIEALKIWNGKREGKKYMIPKKGTQEHAQVMSIMKGQQNGKGITFSKTKIKNIKPEDNIGVDIDEQKREALRQQLRRENLEKRKKERGNITTGTLKQPLPKKNGKGIVQLGRKAPKKKGGEIINPNVDLITEINNLWTGLIGMGLNQTQKNKLKKRIKGGMIDPRDISVVSRISRDLMKTQQKGGLGWAEMTAVNEVLYPLQPKAPSLDTRTGKPVPPSTPFDFLNITF